MRRFFKLEIPTRAAALSFHTLLSLVPAVGLVFWYLVRIGVAERWRTALKQFLLSQLNLGAGEMFLSQFDELTKSVGSGHWGGVGLIVLFYSAWNLITRFASSLDTILEIRSEPTNPFKLRLRRFAVMLVLPLAMVLSLAVSQWIRSDSWLKAMFHVRVVGPIFALPLAWGATIVAVFLLYWLVPRLRTPWVGALKVAILVVPALELLRYLFGIYTRYVVAHDKIYGVFTVVPLFILYVQCVWILLLVGALLIPHVVRKASLPL